MERLTKTVNGVVTYIGTGNKFGKWMLPAELSRCQIRAVMKRLAAYEDTGMEPEDLTKAFNETFESMMISLRSSRWSITSGRMMLPDSPLTAWPSASTITV